MKKILTDNWLLKIASLIFAFCLWLIVINIEDPTTPQTFTNVPIRFENTQVLTEQGLVYEVLEGSSILKSITVYGPRSVVDQLKDEDIVAKADFNELTNANTIPIDITTSRFADKITRMKGNISMVKLNIEQEKTIRLVLRVNAVGTVADGYILGNMTPDQNQIIITGAESVVNRIDKATAEVDVTDATAGIATYADVKLLDKEGNLIESSAITQKVTSVRVSVEVLATKYVPVYYFVMGTPANGYVATGEIESNPSTVLIAGTSSVLNGVNRIEVPAEELNITGQSANMLTVVDLKDYLPNNVILADSSFNGKASVTVFIEKEMVKTFRINPENIHIINVPEGFEAQLEDTDREINLVLSGLEASLNQIDADNIIGYVDLQDVEREEGIVRWKEGTFQTTLKFDFAEDIRVGNPIAVKVELEKVEDE